MDGPIDRRTVLEAAGVLGAGTVTSLGNLLPVYSVDEVDVAVDGGPADSEQALAVDAAVVDPRSCAGNPAAIEFAVTNRSDVERTIQTGIHPPFSVLRADRADVDGGFRLWRSGSPPLHLLPIEAGIPAVGVRHRIASGETQRRRYQVRAGSLVSPGEYVVRSTLDSTPADAAGEQGAPVETLEWTARFRVRAGP